MHTPTKGDLLYLDGLDYELGDQESGLDGATQAVVAIRTFHRPAVADPAIEARLKANPNYALRGKCLEADMVWATVAEMRQALKDQAAALAKGNAHRASWAFAAAEIQADALPDDDCWILPGRLLLKPPTVRRLHAGANGTPVLGDVVLCPLDIAGCHAIASAVLDSTISYHPED